MVIKSTEIINANNIEIGKVIKLELKFSDGVLTIPRAFIKSINSDTIEFEPLEDYYNK